MPIVVDASSPVYASLRREGVDIVAREDSVDRPHARVRVGLLNMMPDACLLATERQFLRLLANCPDLDVHAQLFTITGEPRGPEALDHLRTHYASFDDLVQQGIDALLVTGAFPRKSRLTDEPFWEPLLDVLSWARHQVHSIFCSCLAVHAVLKAYRNCDRVRLPEKSWGVFRHHVVCQQHPLLQGLATDWDGPHSHFYELSRDQFEAAGVQVLVESCDAGVFLATATTDCQWVFMQGHPEYDANSLLKEYKRETRRYFEGDIHEYPPLPANYIPSCCEAVLDDYRRTLTQAKRAGRSLPPFPEEHIEPHLQDTWAGAARQIFVNWLGQLRALAVAGE